MGVTSFIKPAINKLTKSRVFSGIQPTGVPHLGNYFGAIAQWIRLTNDRTIEHNGKSLEFDEPIFCIVDIHAYTSMLTQQTSTQSFGQQLYDNILLTTSSLLALGLDPQKCKLFRQSDVLEHNYLDNVLDNFVTPERLTHMIQFKEKSKENSKSSITNGLVNYPILQAADILLYRANIIPVGEDQTQHIEFTRDIAKKFNLFTKTELFPLPQILLPDSSHAKRIKSLRQPEKKMSKSDLDQKAFIAVTDEPDVIIEKCKKALTDCESAVYFDPDNRPGISNLIRIYHLSTGDSLEKIKDDFNGVESSKFKIKLAEILIDLFSRPRDEFKRLNADRAYLEEVLKLGASKAKPIAEDTIAHVKHLLGSFRRS